MTLGEARSTQRLGEAGDREVRRRGAIDDRRASRSAISAKEAVRPSWMSAILPVVLSLPHMYTKKLTRRRSRLSWLFMSCTLLMLSSVVRMWSHWFEISASLGFYRAAGALAAVTGAALIVSWWLNTGNE